MCRSEASHVPKAYILGTRICADLSLRPTGEELKKILLLACCYQEACARSSPVLISSGVLSGFETGVGRLNPYGKFQNLKPAAIIDYGVFVYDGHFDIPLAGALSLDVKAQALLCQRNAPAAFALAQQALAQAPDSAAVNQALGQVLDANGQSEAANQYYQKALTIAKAEQPAFQAARIDALETRINSKKPDTGGGGPGIR